MDLDGRKISEVFKTHGHPDVTYVERAGSKFEQQLTRGLHARGELCLVTGPSKTGKTTLRTRVAAQNRLTLLEVGCTPDLTALDVWKRALETVRFERTTGTNLENSAKVGGKAELEIGWRWLAKALGRFSIGLEGAESEKEIRERIVSNPSPYHLLPILQELPQLLVIENFHYLSDEVQRVVFSQLKTFVDNEVSVIVVGTTYHPSELMGSLVNANPDLIGHVTHIELGKWDLADLGTIVQIGFAHLDIPLSDHLVDLIAAESVGLPILTQQICAELVISKLQKASAVDESKLSFSEGDVALALFSVANTYYRAAFAQKYDRLIRGPRERARRKYNTYELVLSTFALEPIQYELTRREIDSRLSELAALLDDRSSIPPPKSVDGMLEALNAFQERLRLSLLEWSEDSHKLYIVEPTFLFFLRWREKRQKAPSVRDLVKEMFQQFEAGPPESS